MTKTEKIKDLGLIVCLDDMGVTSTNYKDIIIHGLKYECAGCNKPTDKLIKVGIGYQACCDKCKKRKKL